MNVRQIITPEPQCISPDASLVEAAHKMRELDVGMLPVCENDRLIGAVTDRDITVRAVAEGLSVHTTTVRRVMTPNVSYCFDYESILEAARIMEDRQIRRLPVLSKEKRLVGILSLGDLAVRSGKEELAGAVLGRVCEPAHTVH